MASETTSPRAGRRAGRKSGGREARRAARAAGAAGMAVHPGQPGGQFKPLSDRDIERIHQTALDVLENIGIGQPIPEVLHYAVPKGCKLGEDGRLRFPRSLVEDMIALTRKEYVLYSAHDPSMDLEVKGQQVVMSTSGEAVKILDFETQRFRPTKLTDLYDAARLGDRMEHIHTFGQPFIAAEWSHDLYVHDMNIAYAELSGTRKSFALGIAMVEHIDPLISLFDLHLGREGAFLERPFCIFGGCPIVSPLRFGEENAQVLVKVAELGLVADIAIAGQAGATAPAPLAGALAQSFAETLACLAVVNMVNPGNPMNFGMWPFISDLRTGAFSGGSGEEALISAATVQLCNHYGLISSIASGMTDAKTMDAQAGYEKGISTLAAALAGANLLNTYPGIVGSLIGQSYEGMVIDNDMMGMVQRVLRGIEVTDETLAYEGIEKAVFGSGHYLNQPQTLELMQTEYLYPEIGDRRTVGDWEEAGSPTVYQLAHERVREILSTHYPRYVDPAVDAKIREAFPIKLAPEDMQPGNGRWDD